MFPSCFVKLYELLFEHSEIYSFFCFVFVSAHLSEIMSLNLSNYVTYIFFIYVPVESIFRSLCKSELSDIFLICPSLLNSTGEDGSVAVQARTIWLYATIYMATPGIELVKTWWLPFWDSNWCQSIGLLVMWMY